MKLSDEQIREAADVSDEQVAMFAIVTATVVILSLGVYGIKRLFS